jgi:hypothetical protein
MSYFKFYAEDEKGNNTFTAFKECNKPNRTNLYKGLLNKLDRGVYHCVGWEVYPES